GGRTWAPVQPLGIVGHAPYLYLTGNNILIAGFRHPPTGSTSLAWSTDLGRTWSEPLLVDRVIGGYPRTVELPDGRIIFVYYTEGAGSDIRCVFLRATADGVEVLPKEE
ncbi:MAG: exo-alpha-sialidase, partial [Armatimonadetes bacterium]|nr:exo-alpha-sialidase [Armatimonadota bacterium]